MKRLFIWLIEYSDELIKDIDEEGGNSMQVKILVNQIRKYLYFVWDKAKGDK